MRVAFIYGSQSVAAISKTICKVQVCGPRWHAVLVTMFIQSLVIVVNNFTQRMVLIFFNLLPLLEFHFSTSKALIYLRIGNGNFGVTSWKE